METIKILFCNIIYMSGMASIVALIILTLRKIFDKKISPKWKFAMWALLLVSLIIPLKITLYSNMKNFYTIIDIVDKIKKLVEYSFYGKIFTYIWLIGMAIIFAIYLINSIKIRTKIEKEEIKDKRTLKIFSEAKEEIGIKKDIKLIKQTNKMTPCIYGTIHPKILLTEETMEKSDEILKHIFMHELSHYKRKDIILNKILLILTTIYWFNPIIWFCFKQVRQDMELKADELVLDKLPKQQEKQYAKSLVSILPISEKEKITTHLLYVTDGKKNMERRIKMIKMSDKFKEYKTLIGVTTLTLTLCIGMLIFTQIKPNEEETNNNVKYFETPDRIVYKIKNEDRYYVFEPLQQEYTEILNQITKCIDGIGEGARLSKDDIKKLEQEETYVELDYNTISKNYLVFFEKENYNIIKRTDEGGTVVKNNIKQKEKLKKLLAKKVADKKQYYAMLDTKEYRILEPINYQVPSWSNELKKYEQGIYSVRLGTRQAWENFKENNNIQMTQEIPEEQFAKTNVIATITKYQIEKIETRVGGITIYFKGVDKQPQYYVNLFCISKAVNINCIYRDFSNISYATNLPVVENMTEYLRNDLINQKEINAQIEEIKNENNKIILNCLIFKDNKNYREEILVEKDTQVLANTNNQLQELQKLQQGGYEIYITLKEQTNQGYLVAKNIEVMGC